MALIPPTAVQQQYGTPHPGSPSGGAQGMGPEYLALRSRSIRYYSADIDDWLDHQTQHPGLQTRMQVDQVVPAGNNSAGDALVRWNG